MASTDGLTDGEEGGHAGGERAARYSHKAPANPAEQTRLEIAMSANHSSHSPALSASSNQPSEASPPTSPVSLADISVAAPCGSADD